MKTERVLLLIAQYGFDNVFEIERFMKIVRLDCDLLLKSCKTTLTIQFSGHSPQHMCSIEKFPVFDLYKPLEVMYFGSHNTDFTSCDFLHLHFHGKDLFFVATYPINPWYKQSVDKRFSIWDDSEPSFVVKLPWNVRFILKENVFHMLLQQK